MAWSSSDRRFRLPKNWESLRQQVKRRANGKCQARVHVAECDRIGRECDHVVPGDDHRLSNLQWLSTPCHKAKTKAESQAAYQATNWQAKRRRPRTSRHPGVIP